jgi:hypothetical protein
VHELIAIKGSCCICVCVLRCRLTLCWGAQTVRQAGGPASRDTESGRKDLQRRRRNPRVAPNKTDKKQKKQNKKKTPSKGISPSCGRRLVMMGDILSASQVAIGSGHGSVVYIGGPTAPSVHLCTVLGYGWHVGRPSLRFATRCGTLDS